MCECGGCEGVFTEAQQKFQSCPSGEDRHFMQKDQVQFRRITDVEEETFISDGGVHVCLYLGKKKIWRKK